MSAQPNTTANAFVLRNDSGKHLGELLTQITEAHDKLLEDFNALQAKYSALLVSLDAANLPGISGSAAATFGADPSSATAPRIE